MNDKRTAKHRVNSLTDYDGKMPPHDGDIEKATLGALILDSSIIDRFIGEFSPSLFYYEEHRQVAECIVQLVGRNSRVDLLTIKNELKRLNYDVHIGAVSQWTNQVASTSRFEYHFRILQDNSLKRNFIQINSESLRKSFDNTEDIYKVIIDHQSKIENAYKHIGVNNLSKVGEIHKRIINESYQVVQEGKKSGVPSGLEQVDNVTNGWQKSDLIILAGRPGMGKTAFAISALMHPCLAEKKPIAVFSCEMSEEQLVGRMQSYLSEINVGSIVRKQLNLEEIQIIQDKAFVLEDAPIFIDDTPALSLIELKSKARRLKKEHNIEMIIIDYLQLMRSGLDTKNREQEIAEISRGLKAIAKELDIPVIALSQLSRSVETRGGDKKPQLSDLRESGQIEQDADMVLFCYRPEYYEIDSYEVGGREFDADGLFLLLISKHRNGELGEIPLKFIKTQAKVVSYNHSHNHFGNKNQNSTFVQINREQPQSNLNNFRNESFDRNESDAVPF